jgi:hypothetical protein
MLTAGALNRCAANVGRRARAASQIASPPGRPDRNAAVTPTPYGRVSSTAFNAAFVLSAAVREALRNRQPVVALEVCARRRGEGGRVGGARHAACIVAQSTIISHGMPYPDNVATALQVSGQSAGVALPYPAVNPCGTNERRSKGL